MMIRGDSPFSEIAPVLTSSVDDQIHGSPSPDTHRNMSPLITRSTDDFQIPGLSPVPTRTLEKVQEQYIPGLTDALVAPEESASDHIPGLGDILQDSSKSSGILTTVTAIPGLENSFLPNNNTKQALSQADKQSEASTTFSLIPGLAENISSSMQPSSFKGSVFIPDLETGLQGLESKAKGLENTIPGPEDSMQSGNEIKENITQTNIPGLDENNKPYGPELPTGFIIGSVEKGQVPEIKGNSHAETQGSGML